MGKIEDIVEIAGAREWTVQGPCDCIPSSTSAAIEATGSNSSREVSAGRDCTTDVLYLFALHLEWRDRGSLLAYEQLVSALDDCDDHVRAAAEALLQRASPRPKRVRVNR